MSIPLKLRKEINSDPEYQNCMLYGWHGHECGGRLNTREHAITFKGSSLQKKWAIISLCARGHEVDQFQDAHTMKKELNVWVALNRATHEELMEVSKAIDYFRKRSVLNEKYGRWFNKNVYQEGSDINY